MKGRRHLRAVSLESPQAGPWGAGEEFCKDVGSQEPESQLTSPQNNEA